MFLASGGVINWNAGDVTLTHSSNLLTIGGGNLSVPVIYGGSGTGSSLTLRSTSGVGATDSIVMGIGNNGATQAFSINNQYNNITFGENAGVTFNSSTLNNVAIGYEAGRYASTTFVDNNVFLGYQAGRQSDREYNVFVGSGAGHSNTNSENVFIGLNAGYFNTGYINNFIGTDAGRDNTGNKNYFIGAYTGYSNSGESNTFIGEGAGYSNTGSYNNIFGYYGSDNLVGQYNDIIGYQTAYFLQSTSTVAIGGEALMGTGNYEGLNNVALGYRAGFIAETGASNNILLGYQAADNLTTGNNNIIIGYDIDNVTATADNVLNIGNLIFGTGIDGTGTTLSSGNVGIGTSSPNAKLSVAGNVFFTATTTLSNGKIVIGTDGVILPTPRGVTNSFFVGTDAGKSATAATNSNFLGNSAGISATNASYSNFFGPNAGYAATNASYSNFFGSGAGSVATNASYSNFIGGAAGLNATNAATSNFIGVNAGNNAANARDSIFIGSYAGFVDSVNNTSNSGTSIAIGRYSGTGGFSNSIALGRGVINSAATQLNIGNLIYGSGIYNSDTQSAAPTSGSVGIGTSTPASKLDVYGDFRVGTGSVSTLFVDASLGNVGIGTTTPTKEFVVVGDTSLIGNLILGIPEAGSNSMSATNYSLAGGYMTAFASGDITASGNGSMAFGYAHYGDILATGHGSLAFGDGHIAASGAGSIALGRGEYQNGGRILSQGIGSFAAGYSETNDVVASGDGSFVFGDNISATANFATAFGKDFVNSTANTFQIGYSSIPTFTANSAGVGIGTSTPLSKLDVWGNVRIGTTSNSYLNFGTAVSAAGYGFRDIAGTLQFKNSGGSWTALGAGSSIWTENGSDIYFTTGYVGIGTTTPRSGLDIYGTSKNSNTLTIGDVLTTGGYLQFGSNVDLNMIQYSSGEFGIYTDQDSGLRFYTNSDVDSTNPELVITQGGNTGIGTSTPNKKLQVLETVSDDQFRISYDATRYADFQVASSGALYIDAQGGDVYLADENLHVCTGGSCPTGISAGTGNALIEGDLFVDADGVSGAGLATSTFMGDVLIAGKLDVGTIDPVYRIDETKYATYGMSSIGIKEEVGDTMMITDYNSESGYYEKVVAWSDLPEAEDLWLFYQITDFGTLWEHLTVSLTAGFDGRVFYQKDVANNALVIKATAPGEVSATLSANRFDWRQWGNVRPDQDGSSHFELESK